MRPRTAFLAGAALRLLLLAFSYTDIDYLVFTDAARFVAAGRSPYARATYRYTPLLAWLLLPATRPGCFAFGKLLFAAADLAAAGLIYRILRGGRARSTTAAGPSAAVGNMDPSSAAAYACIWLLNPIVAGVSTRGSSEGLVVVVVLALLWAALRRRVALAGALLGLGVHFKIYPFVYAASIFWALDGKGGRTGDEDPPRKGVEPRASVVDGVLSLFNAERVTLATTSLVTFMALNGVMYALYGMPFVEHSYTYHLTRIDHRHNFSVYNTLLHLNSAEGSTAAGIRAESFAFVPQLLLSVVAIPLLLAKKDLPGTMLAQTFAFVTFNKVCTSQYFLWYMVFLPFYLPSSTLLQQPRVGIAAAVLWVAGQAIWLQQGYELEFLGKSAFVPGLWTASAAFFLVNCWILGIVVADIGRKRPERISSTGDVKVD